MASLDAIELLNAFDFGDNVDTNTFEQILDMDDEDDDTFDFSHSIVFGFLEQAENTFGQMDEALDNKKLDDLSSLGHFLKGSSATLGYTKIKDECEKIQHFGAMKDETGTNDQPDQATALELIDESLSEAKRAFKIVEDLMRRFYAQLMK